MKKTLLVIVSLCMVMALSCATGGGGAAAPAAEVEVGNLGAFTLKMDDNFQYGDGYQGMVRPRELLGGQRLAVGETWLLKMTLTVSRDLENELVVGFADTTEAAGWWKWLSFKGDEEKHLGVIPGSKIKAGEVFSAEFEMNIVQAPTGGSTQANTLVFETAGEGRKGSQGSGVQKPFEINFTEFVLTKK